MLTVERRQRLDRLAEEAQVYLSDYYSLIGAIETGATEWWIARRTTKVRRQAVALRQAVMACRDIL